MGFLNSLFGGGSGMPGPARWALRDMKQLPYSKDWWDPQWRQALAGLGSVQAALGAVKTQPKIINEGFNKAQAQTQAVGRGAYQRIKDLAVSGQGAATQSLQNAGLANTTALANLQRGVGADALRRSFEVDQALSGARSTIEAERTKALAGAAQARAAGLGALAQYRLGLSNMLERRRLEYENVLSTYAGMRTQGYQYGSSRLGQTMTQIGQGFGFGVKQGWWG